MDWRNYEVVQTSKYIKRMQKYKIECVNEFATKIIYISRNIYILSYDEKKTPYTHKLYTST